MVQGVPPPARAVVVTGTGRAALERTVAEVLRGEASGADPLEVLVAWAGEGAPPALPPQVEVVEVMPLGAAYAFNRCLQQVVSPVATFVRAGRRPPVGGLSPSGTGPLARWSTFDVAALRRAGGFDHAVDRTAVVEARLRLTGPRFAARVTRRMVVRPTDGAVSDPRLLRHAPEPVRSAVGDVRPLASSLRAKSHWMYDAPPDRVLHLYAAPSARLRRAAGEREQIRSRARVGGVPRLHAAVPGRDSLWVLEDRVPGRRVAGRPSSWFGPVSTWVVGLGGPPGPPLADSPYWPEHREHAVAAVPAEARTAVARAMTSIERLPSRAMHGDLQPKNVVVSDAAVGAVDWEGAWLHGVPGLDLVFLALFAHGDVPDATLLPALLTGHEPPATPVLRPLEQLGVGRAQVPALVMTCLALWTAGEARRGVRLGAPAPADTSRGFFRQQWSLAELQSALRV